jgi:hypothetical protein
LYGTRKPIHLPMDVRTLTHTVCVGGVGWGWGGGRPAATWRKVLARVPSDLGRKLEYFLATGNLVSNTGLDLQQARPRM